MSTERDWIIPRPENLSESQMIRISSAAARYSEATLAYLRAAKRLDEVDNQYMRILQEIQREQAK